MAKNSKEANSNKVGLMTDDTVISDRNKPIGGKKDVKSTKSSLKSTTKDQQQTETGEPSGKRKRR